MYNSKISEEQFHVWHFTCGLNPRLGGIFSGIENIASNLVKYAISGTVLSYGNSAKNYLSSASVVKKMELTKVEVLQSSTLFSNPYGLGNLINLKGQKCKASGNSLVVLHQIYTLSTLIGYRFAKKSRIPFAVFPHGSLTNYHDSESKLRKRIARLLLFSRILREADAIIVTCTSEREDLDIFLKPKAVLMSYGDVINDLYYDRNTDAANDSENMRILFSGRFDKKKNLKLLVTAMPTIISKYPLVTLAIAGSGNKKETRELYKLINFLNIEKHIEFHGWVDKSRMKELLVSARLLVLPSENENFGLVVSEALSSGVPCVVSKFVGTSDIVAKHHAGEIIEELTPKSVAASVVKLLEGDQNSYREAAFKAAREDLDWSKIALKWKELISTLTVE